MRLPVHLTWTIDCEATQRAIGDVGLGERAIRGFVEVMADAGMRATLFALPGEAAAMPTLFHDVLATARREGATEGFEVGLHLHPQEEGYRDFCGAYTGREQAAMYADAVKKWSDALGFAPRSFRTGSFSATDETFAATAEAGLTNCSHSCPGRRMTSLRANWDGAPPYVHYAHPANRLLEGGLDLVEVPISTDPDSMLWSGGHPQDLRVELFDAKNQRYLIDKLIARERSREHPVRSIVALTHNQFDYDRPDDFRRQTLKRMLADFAELADKHDVELIPSTIDDVAAAYRRAVPLEGDPS